MSGLALIGNFSLSADDVCVFRFDAFHLDDIQGEGGKFFGVAKDGKEVGGVGDSFEGDVDVRDLCKFGGVNDRAPLPNACGAVVIGNVGDDGICICLGLRPKRVIGRITPLGLRLKKGPDFSGGYRHRVKG